jgi:hypothetical protein
MKIENYYLDLEKVSQKSKEEQDRIHSYYMEMMHCFSDKRESMGKSIFYTLYTSEYLKEIRDEKIEKLLS